MEGQNQEEQNQNQEEQNQNQEEQNQNQEEQNQNQEEQGKRLALVVGLSLCDSAPLLWRVQDLRTIRSLGLVGALLGSLPRTPRQNLRLGRPLLLLPEEERLLRENRAAAVLPEQNQVREPRQYEEEQQRSFQEQSALALEDRKSALLRAMTSSRAESGTGFDEALQRRLLDLDQNFTFPQSALAVQLSTTRAGLSYCPEARAFLQANWPVRAQDDPCCEARYQVFRDLRGRGFFLTSAGKFGGDFLVYPGDPLRFHAHFIAVCLTLDESICLLDVLAVARLGSNVKKTVLLCSPAPDGAVRYTSLQWSGMV
uniref:tRNA-splicing endonuclease subunit Sen34 n=1 Tax=Kryptolebias marmoratus TaxID=37003 RepID=A0A3Q3A1C1_KRYMA